VTPWVLTRESLGTAVLAGSLCTAPVRDGSGRVVVEKGTPLGEDDRHRLAGGTWDTLHLVRCDAGDLLEDDAGSRLARAVQGAGVELGPVARGQWPLCASWRGILEVDATTLAVLNANEDLSVYTLFDGQVVESGEVVGCAKVIPFVVPEEDVVAAEALAVTRGAPLRVRKFSPHRVAAVVLESLADGARTRFAEGFAEKVRWFGGTLDRVDHVAPAVGAVCAAIEGAAASCHLTVVAGTRAMDPLDPALVSLDTLGARRVRRGMAAHPGSLCWIAQLGDGWIIGLPSCGVLSQATIFDLVFTWLFADMPITPERLASIGHGGLLTRDMAYRFPPYRTRRTRGEVE
jgi:molybdenum cofactor cytidylyltransferase